MATEVTLGAAMRANLLSLQNTQKSIDVTQLRLATGKKVNSALDNPQSYFASNSLNQRASDLSRLLDGIGQSIRAIEEADKGVTALTNLVNQADSIASEAQSAIRAAEGYSTITGTTDLRDVNLTGSGTGLSNGNTFTVTIKDADVASNVNQTATITVATGDTVYDLAAKINDATAIGNSNFSDNIHASVDKQGRLKIESREEGAIVRLASTTIGAAGIATLGLTDYVGQENLDNVATGRQGGTVVTGRTLTSATANANAKDSNGNYIASKTLGNAAWFTAADSMDQFEITVDGETFQSGTIASTDTIQSLLDKINNSAILANKVTASFTSEGKLELDVADSVSTVTINFEANAIGDVYAFGFGTGAADATMTAATDHQSETFHFVSVDADLSQFTSDYNKVRTQIDGIVRDANYRGVNLLSGDTMTTYFNEDKNSYLETVGDDLSSTGLGLDEVNFIDNASVEEAISNVANALEQVRTFGASIANDLSIMQTRQQFTTETINTLEAGANDLTTADLNEEGANLLALQTAQQLGVTSLSLASQSQQSVLRLF